MRYLFFILIFLTPTFAFATSSVTGVGTDTLTVTTDFADGDRILDYIGDTSIGFYAPITSSPQTITVSNESGATFSDPLRLIETSTGCFGLSYDYDTCLATGVAVGNSDGYYISSGVWFVVSSDVYGCTDPEANNYDPSATIDDDTCTYDPPEPTPLGETEDSMPISEASIALITTAFFSALFVYVCFAMYRTLIKGSW